jgi:hypothetical protein
MATLRSNRSLHRGRHRLFFPSRLHCKSNHLDPRHGHAHVLGRYAEYRFGVKELHEFPLDQYPDAKSLCVEVVKRFSRMELHNSNASVGGPTMTGKAGLVPTRCSFRGV